MKIAIFPPSLEVGGVQRVALSLARGFLAQNIDVELVLIKKEGAFLDHVPPELPIVDLQATRALTSIVPLSAYLRKSQPDVLLAISESVNLPAIWAKMLPRSGKTKIAVMVVNTLSQYQANTNIRREKVYTTLTRWFYPRADYVIALSEGIRQDLAAFIHFPLDRIITMPSPVLTPDFYERANQPISHYWFDEDTSEKKDDIPIILGVARFVQAKDLETLIRAFAIVRAQRPARLLIIGDGEDRPKLEALVSELGLSDEDVSLPGFLHNLPYMKATDVFVLSSVFEGLPTVLIESLACSPAIVSTDCPSGPQEILDGGKYGIIVPMRDPQAMATAIMHQLDHPPDVEPLRKQAQNYSMEVVINRYLELFGNTQ
ncbi:MAG: glycosyltransferase [Aggregatilineales bacterium]